MRWFYFIVLVFPLVESPPNIVESCPSADNWHTRANHVCPGEPEKYHCLYAINCTKLVEFCRKPQSGRKVESYYYDVENEKPILYKGEFNGLMSNDPKMHKFEAHLCDNYTYSENPNNCTTDSNSWHNVCVVFLILFIISFIINILLICTSCRKRNQNKKINKHGQPSEETESDLEMDTKPTRTQPPQEVTGNTRRFGNRPERELQQNDCMAGDLNI